MSMTCGATHLGEGRCRFLVWAPLAEKVEAQLVSPRERLVSLEKRARGCYHAVVQDVEPGTLSLSWLNGKTERPHSASRFQPQGVHGPSRVVDLCFDWLDQRWHGLPL